MGLKMTDEDVARVGRELDAGHATVGVLTWDFETNTVADKLTEPGGTPETHEVAQLTAEPMRRSAPPYSRRRPLVRRRPWSPLILWG